MSKDLKIKIIQDDDTINYPRTKNSLKKFLSKYPDGVSDDKIAKVLMLTEEEVQEIYNGIINKFRKALKVSND